MCSRTLEANGIPSKIVIVNDNNDIDREVRRYDPTHVIIEALWVIPEKFKVLISLYPKIQWIIRMHSEVPFMANEGVATYWLYQYTTFPEVRISGNSDRLTRDLGTVVHNHKPVYLPNCYVFEPVPKFFHKQDNYIDIACMGAVRPLKNQLTQAVAAIKFASQVGRPLRFHINGDRVEDFGNPVLKNLTHLFDSRWF